MEQEAERAGRVAERPTPVIDRTDAPAPDPAPALAIEVAKAVVLADRFPALAELDLELPVGSVTLLQGPNGAGKTTLLRLLAGLAPITSGRARVLGFDVTRQRRAVRSSVGLVGPDAMHYADLTVGENLAFWAAMSGYDSAHSPGEAGRVRVLERVGIADLVDQPVATLSTGQRRRAALASVIVRRPRLWLLDEPHAGLDQAGRDIVDSLISDAIGAGATVLVASHEIDRVRPLATDIVTVAGGGLHRHEKVASSTRPPGATGSSGSTGATGSSGVSGATGSRR